MQYQRKLFSLRNRYGVVITDPEQIAQEIVARVSWVWGTYRTYGGTDTGPSLLRHQLSRAPQRYPTQPTLGLPPPGGGGG